MTKKTHIVFGGKGFIGQNLAREIIREGNNVIIIDKDQWKIDLVYSELLRSTQVNVQKLDIVNDLEEMTNVLGKIIKSNEDVTVWHLAANSDISAGNSNLDVDLTDTFLTTVNVLKVCRTFNVASFYFASSSAVYGDTNNGSSGLKEDDATQPISNYGAMKLASEAIIRAAHQQFLNRAIIFRFPNVIGYPATHGVIRDFIEKLKTTPNKLMVLGDGNQSKPYLHVSDLVNAMLYLDTYYTGTTVMETINIGSPYENVFVKKIAEEVKSRISPTAEIVYGATPHGWIGDMPTVNFNIDKILKTGWKCELSGIDAVRLTINEIIGGEAK
jgi:UDP-glucose 4-epimerase